MVLFLKLCPVGVWSNESVATSWACREMEGKLLALWVYCRLQWWDLTNVVDQQKTVLGFLLLDIAVGPWVEWRNNSVHPHIWVWLTARYELRNLCGHCNPQLWPSKQEIPGHWLATRAVAPHFSFLPHHIVLLHQLDKWVWRRVLHTPKEWIMLKPSLLDAYPLSASTESEMHRGEEFQIHTFSSPPLVNFLDFNI